jgi:hypothetical protein
VNHTTFDASAELYAIFTRSWPNDGAAGSKKKKTTHIIIRRTIVIVTPNCEKNFS